MNVQLKGKSSTVLGGLAMLFTLITPVTGFAATNSQATQNYTIHVSGATELPQPDPVNGILAGGACSPDTNQFNLAQKLVTNVSTGKPEPNHMVFAVQITPGDKNTSKVLTEADIAKDTTVYVRIYDAAGNFIRLYNVPKSATPDPNTKNPYFVQCVWLSNAQLATKFNETMLPAGTYRYNFLVSVSDPKTGLIQKTWTPSDNTFTLVDSSATS